MVTMVSAVKRGVASARPYMVQGWKRTYPLAIKSVVYTRDQGMHIFTQNIKFCTFGSIAVYLYYHEEDWKNISEEISRRLETHFSKEKEVEQKLLISVIEKLSAEYSFNVKEAVALVLNGKEKNDK